MDHMANLQNLPLSKSSRILFLWIAVFVVVASLVCQSGQGYDLLLPLKSQNTTLKHKVLSSIKRSDFPSDFLFGVATSATQIEGSTKADGRGASVYDEYIRKFQDKVFDKSNMDVAIDSYRRYKEDVKALKDLRVQFYRFSISWTRILPNGSFGGINQEGINHYNNLIDELIKNGIKPFVTMFHFDSPQTLEERYGGPLSHSFVDDFKEYAEICFNSFGDRVKNWITINEPIIIAKYGYDTGFGAPARCSDRKKCEAGNSSTEPYIVAHNLLLAHATVVNLYRMKFQPKQGGEIGIAHIGQYYEPYSKSISDISAAKRTMDFQLGWFLEPLVYGRYPKSMVKIVKDRLPTFTSEETKLVKNSFDFIGINYYTTRYAKGLPINLNSSPISYTADQFMDETTEKNGVPIGPKAEGSFYLYIYPKGLQKILNFVKKQYGNPKIYITENGFSQRRNDSVSIDVVLNDQDRIDFIVEHLHQLKRTIKSGVNVKGYFYWNLFDDFEWIEGFIPRFGLYYTDYKNNFTHLPKESAKWYHNFLKGGQN